MRVIIQDDTLRRTKTIRITVAMQEARLKAGLFVPAIGTQMNVTDSHGKTILETVIHNHIFEGYALVHAINRARRWMRRISKGGRGRMPHHIALKMAAFQKALPKEFAQSSARWLGVKAEPA